MTRTRTLRTFKAYRIDVDGTGMHEVVISGIEAFFAVDAMRIATAILRIRVDYVSTC